MIPRDAEAYLQLGRSCRLQGRFPEAETALRQALEHDPQNGGVRFEMGALYQDQNRLIEAAAEFESALAIDPNMAGVHGQLGRLYRRQGRLPEAEAALRKALELDPQDGGTRFELGALYECQGKFLQAAAEFEKTIAIDPNHGGAYRQLGRIYRRQDRSSEAEAALNRALEFDAQDGGTRFELGVLYESQGKFSQAAAEFEKNVAADPNHGGAHHQLGRIYRRQGRSSEAEAALNKALEFDSQDDGARFELGILYEGQGGFFKAAAEFEKIVAADPNHSGAQRQLGRIYRRQGRWPESEAVLNKALELDPQSSHTRIELGSLYQDQCRFLEAGAEFQKALAIDPRSGDAHLYLGHIYLRRGRWLEAEAEFQEAADLDPRKGGGYVGLWAVYHGQGRLAEAAAALVKALAIDPISAFACTELLDRLDRDKAIGGRADEPMPERAFCLLPWTNLHARTDGTALPCCVWRGPQLGNVRFLSIDELWNSPILKALRLDMLKGRPVAGCQRCYKDERSGFLSMRQKISAALSRHDGRKSLTMPDGTLPRLPVVSIDIRFSNACNLRCRMCDLTQSSAWAADARARGLRVEGGPIQKAYDDWDVLWRQLQPLLEDGIDMITFIGGEPLIMEEHYRILDFLIARGRTDVRLRYNTNFSTLRFQGRDVIDLWSRFHDVRVDASLDGSGRRGEYLRKGLSWDAVVANREEMLRRCPDIAFSVAPTINIFNALHLPDFHREWVEKGYVDRNAFALNMLLAPAMYRMQVLPPALKQRVLEAYRRHQESFLDADGTAARDFAAAARSLQAKDYSELLPDFVAMTRELDRLRGEDCREAFPELSPLFEAAE